MTAREHLGARVVGTISRSLPVRRWQTSYWLGRALAPTRPFIGRFQGGLMEVRPGEIASMQAFYLGFFEREVSMLCRREIECGPPDLVVDVGANFGYYPLVFGLLTKGRTRVIAFEPDPSNAAWLRRNIELNPGLDVTIVPMAVGSESEDAVAFDASGAGHKAWSKVSRVQSAHDHEWTSIQVPMTSLDSYLDCASIDTVPLTLIDVEGYEGETIAGMREGLARHRYQKIMIEFHPWAFASEADIKRIATRIVDAGYRGFRIRHHAARHPDKVRSYYQTRFDDSILQPLAFDNLSAWEHFWFEADPGH
jgi:FkbM family methyltransferase